MNSRDHAVTHRDTTESIKAAGPSSGTNRTLLLTTKESSPPPSVVHNVDNTTAHFSATEDSEGESSSCTICLNAYEDRAVLETCHHEFCFSCIMQWSTLSHTCPLCIRPFTSCIHDIQDDQHFSTHQFEPLSHARSPSGRPTASDTTLPHGIIRRLYGPPQFRRRTRNRPPQPESAEEQSVADRQQAALESRRNVYRNGLFVRHIGASRISGYQQITPETFRIFPQRLDRLVPWIRRELQAITTLAPSPRSEVPSQGLANATTTRSADNNAFEETDSGLEIIREYIIAVCRRYDLQTDQGQDLIRDFLHEHTEHFVHELMGFARSPFSIEAYDRSAQYTSSSSSSSSTPVVAPGGGGNIREVINSEDSVAQERRKRTRRRSYDSPGESRHSGGRRDTVHGRDEKRIRRSDHDRESLSHSCSRGADREFAVESTTGRSSKHTSKRSSSPEHRRTSSSSTKKEVGSTHPMGSSSRKALESDESSTMASILPTAAAHDRDAPKELDLNAILLAKLKREQDLYVSRNNKRQ